ncbi:LptM family lipoprotein [Thiomicrorhabdus arctica]|uniref:LptM family lipoprotein n=1 Tax=Thiomicrorhabdus arctica TaxID=131540 RepID=UPI000369D1C9|nr:hypothetical protein [Thiomicrorhabdus arctica]
MQKKWISFLMLAVVSFLLTACGVKPIHEVESKVVPNSIENSDQVKQAIKRAGMGLGWIIKEVDASTLEGTLFLRRHVARITIPYSSSQYSLLYKSSEQLDYDEEEKTIHSNYNGWIMNLDRAIQVQLIH